MNKQVVSAGGLICKKEGEHFLVLLVGKDDPTKQCIPKGMQEKGETLEETAMREVKEETGISTTIDTYVDCAQWTYEYGGEMWDETAEFFLLIPQGGDTQLHDSEFDRVEWFEIEEAIRKLHYPKEQRIAHVALSMLRVR